MNEFTCPKCKSSFTIGLAHVLNSDGRDIIGQPVIHCDCGACVIPYLGEQANRETIARIEERLS
jgi:hypothetical protein